LATSEESFLISYENLHDSLKRQIQGAHTIFIEAIDDINEYPGNWNKKYDSLQKAYPDFFAHPGYEDYWEILKEVTGKSNDNRILKKAVERESISQINDAFIDRYITDTYNISKKEEKQIRDHQLVMLGRGWVKVGIDFANFDEDNFRYDKAHHKINLFRKRPEIISASINPWLSPEKHIRGFEMLRVHNRIDDNAELVKKVKSLCLEKLIKQAEEAGIMEQAIQNAETNLSAFFSLILDETVTVYIFGHVLEAYAAEFVTDSIITFSEQQAADALVKKYFQHDTRDAIRFYGSLINQLEEYKVNNLYDSLSWNFRSLYIEIAADSILNANEESKIDTLSATPASIDFFYYFMEKWSVKEKDQATDENERLKQFEALVIQYEKERERDEENRELVFSDVIEKLTKENELDSAVTAFHKKNINILNTLISKLKREEIPLVANDSLSTDTSN
jgi:hypothetical protein